MWRTASEGSFQPLVIRLLYGRYGSYGMGLILLAVVTRRHPHPFRRVGPPLLLAWEGVRRLESTCRHSS